MNVNQHVHIGTTCCRELNIFQNSVGFYIEYDLNGFK
jgi:hypothetical protein